MCVMNKNKHRFYLIVFLLKASNNLTPRGEMCVCMNMNFLWRCCILCLNVDNLFESFPQAAYKYIYLIYL